MRLFGRNLSTRIDDDLFRSSAASGAEGFDLSDDVHAFNNLSEDNVVTIEPRRLNSADEELGSVGVGSSVSHAQNS